MNLIYLSLAWVLGILLGSRFSLPWNLLIALSVVSVVICVGYIAFRKRYLLLAGLCLLLLCGGMFRFSFLSEGDPLQNYRGFYEIQGVVAASPQTGHQTTALQVEARHINDGNTWREISGRFQVYASKYPAFDSRDFPYYHYGDLIEFHGILRSPITTGNENDFDYAAYLAGQNIYSVMYSPVQIELIDAGRKSNGIQWVHHLRRSISSSLKNTISEPQCSISQAMLIGERSSITSQMRDDFARAGVSHILAISGLHVAILTGIVMSVAVWMFGRRRPTYILFALGVLWLYVILSGMSPSAVRAAIMGSLWLWAIWLGRQKSAFTAISFTAAIMLAVNPRLLNDLAFQLSFAAMSGIIFITPIFQTFGYKLWAKKRSETPAMVSLTVNSFAVTLGAVLTTLPLVAYYFNYISLMSLPTTLLTLPAVPLIIVGSALTGITGLFAPSIATIVGWPVWLCARYIIEVVELCAGLPFASVELQIDAPTVYSYYGILAVCLWTSGNFSSVKELLQKTKSGIHTLPRLYSTVPLKWIILPLVVVTVLVWTAAVTALDHRLHVYILDVGEGDAILIQKENQQVLIDGGPDSNTLLNELGDRLPYWDKTIELVILTHADADHITGLIEVVRRYQVQKVIINGRNPYDYLYNEWNKLIEEKGIECIVSDPGQQIVMDEGIILTVIHPNHVDIENGSTSSNHLSIVTRLEYENFSMLFTGDIDTQAEQLLLKGDSHLRSTALKIAHHGAGSSSSNEFLKAVAPHFAVVSCGSNNRFGHPSENVMDRISQLVDEGSIFTTASDGTIEFVSDGIKLWVRTEK